MRETPREAPLLIEGRRIPSSSGAWFERTHPLTHELVTRAAAATLEDARAAVEAASRAFSAWADRPPSDRRRVLLKAADLLESRADEIAETALSELGTSRSFIGFNIALGAGILREAAALATQVTGEIIPADRPGTLAFAVRQPVGVVLSLAPWNAPVILALRAIAFPVACGNTVVFKSSELSPATQYLLGEVLQQAGLPDGVLNTLSTAPADAPAIVEALIAHPDVRRVNFTGSTRVGRILAEIAGRHLKPIVLELGGKAPLVVLDDANLEEAAKAVTFGAFANQGQICMSTERVVVSQAVADELVARLVEQASSLTVGDPRERDVDLGCLITEAAAERVERLIDDAVRKGATLATGGKRVGALVWPTILDGVHPDMEIYHEESFGPVAVVVRVRDDAEAIRVANDTEYGLAASVFSRDLSRAVSVARRIQSGICHVNGPTVYDEPQMPFGGTKASGYGRLGGRAAIHEFTELRWITVQTRPVPA